MIQEEKFTKYEKARIIGARALQIAMNAPLLIKISKDDLEKINYDALKIAEVELESDALPISIHRPFPQKKEGKLKRVKVVQLSEEKLKEIESQDEKEIVGTGEIMELVNPEDEREEESNEDSGED